MAARDGYLRVANENPQFDGMETRVERDDKNIPIKAVCTVWRKDRNHPDDLRSLLFGVQKEQSGVESVPLGHDRQGQRSAGPEAQLLHKRRCLRRGDWRRHGVSQRSAGPRYRQDRGIKGRGGRRGN
jgi:hypothetical protein